MDRTDNYYNINEKVPSTVKTVEQKTDHLENRVTGLERDVQHLTAAVAEQGRQMTSGFDRLTHMMESNEKKQVERDTALQERITSQEKTHLASRQTNWSTVFLGLGGVFTVMGAFVSFVLLTQSPTNRMLREHLAQDGHVPSLVEIASIKEQIAENTHELDLLWDIKLKEHPKTEQWRGQIESHIENIIKQQDRRRPIIDQNIAKAAANQERINGLQSLILREQNKD